MKKKYGKNFNVKICNKNFIFGISNTIFIVILMTILFVFLLILSLIFMNNFYHFSVYLILIILFLLMLVNYLLCFFKEPGIIPRNCKEFQLPEDIKKIVEEMKENEFKINNENEDENNNNNNSENNNNENNNENNSENDNNENNNNENNNNENNNEINNENNNENNNNNKEDNNKLIINNNNIPNINLSNSNTNEINTKTNNKKNLFQSKLLQTTINRQKLIQKLNDQYSLKYLNKSHPYFYQSRPCITCEIIRPSKASHCSICDNCVLGFDHHCVYVSNCVGIRNYKNFILFLMFGSIVSFFLCLMLIYHLIYVYFLFNFHLTKMMFFNYKIIFIVDIIIFVLNLVFFCVFFNYYFLIFFCFLCEIVLIIIFYLNRKKYFIVDFPFFYNNFSLIFLSFDVFLFAFVFGNFVSHCKRAGKNLRLKEIHSLNKQNVKNENENVANEINEILNVKWKFENFWNLITMKTPKSLFDDN